MVLKQNKYDSKGSFLRIIPLVLVLAALYSFFLLETANITQLFIDKFDSSSSTPLDWKAIRQLEITIGKRFKWKL